MATRAYCECGELLRWGEIPNPIEWLLISDEAFDGFGEAVDSSAVYHSMTHALRCPKCGRFWIFWQGFSKDPEELLPKSLVDKG